MYKKMSILNSFSSGFGFGMAIFLMYLGSMITSLVIIGLSIFNLWIAFVQGEKHERD